MNYPVSMNNLRIEIRVPFAENYRAKSIPNARWDKIAKVWWAPMMKGSARAVLENFHGNEIEPSLIPTLTQIRDYQPPESAFPDHHVFKNPPMKHQERALNKAYGKNAFALFMRMRTGKTFVSLMLAERYYEEDQIDAVMVSCPTSVKSVWLDEIRKHMSVETDVFVMVAGANASAKRWTFKDNGKLKIIIFGTESFSAGSAWKVADQFIDSRRVMMVLDESHMIKNSKSIRTERVTNMGARCVKSLILSGTPITQGIEDLYAQYNFLSPDIIGMKSFFQFRNRYCVMGGFEQRQIVGYNNTRELMDIIAPYSIRVETAEAFPNLPDRINRTILLPPTDAQVKAMRGLKTMLEAAQGDKEITIKTALERTLRFQQIAGGHFPYLDEDTNEYGIVPIEGKNPKIEAIKELVEADSKDQKYIIWAVFIPEIEAIEAELVLSYGRSSVVTFHGGVDEEGREHARRRFQEDPECRFFVGNQATGGMGIKLSAANIMVYYSNSFKYMDRDQSGDRWIDHERVKHMLVVDLVLDIPADRNIIAALQNKEDVATYVAKEMQK